MLHLKSREGSPVTVALADNYAVSLIVKADVASIKPNDYIAVAGIPEIDRFTLFRCQDDTIRLLRAAAPDVRLDSRVALWGRTKRCAG